MHTHGHRRGQEAEPEAVPAPVPAPTAYDLLPKEIQELNDERDALFCKYLWDGGTELVWAEVNGRLVQTERELVPDITRMMDEDEPAAKICPYVPSPMARMRRLADFGSFTAEDVVVDIGCGDGRVLLHLVQQCGCMG